MDKDTFLNIELPLRRIEKKLDLLLEDAGYTIDENTGEPTITEEEPEPEFKDRNKRLVPTPNKD